MHCRRISTWIVLATLLIIFWSTCVNIDQHSSNISFCSRPSMTRCLWYLNLGNNQGGICSGDARDYLSRWFTSSTHWLEICHPSLGRLLSPSLTENWILKMVLLNKRAENNGKMCQKLMKFDRSCRLMNVPHCNSFLTYWLVTLIDTDIILINNNITVIDAFNSGKCKKILNLVEILQLLGDFVPRSSTGTFALGLHWGTSVPQIP